MKVLVGEFNFGVEKVGYKVLEENHISCENCKKRLLELTKVSEGTTKNYFIVKCPFCNTKSFKYLIEGKVYSGASPGLNITNIQTDAVGNTYVNNIEVKPCQTK